MKNFSHTAIQKAMCILLTAGLLFSCGQMEPFEAEEINQLAVKAMSAAPDCDSDCIEPGSGNYFEKTGSLSERSGINTKVVSYTAFNTEDAFIVNVAYRITTGPAKGKASITINIGGVEKEFKEIPSGRTVSYSIKLPEGWKGCDVMGFEISQTGMGKPIRFSEKYGLVPVCPVEEEIEFVVMGNQIWSKYNLNVDRYRNGDPIPEIQDFSAWKQASTGAWCYLFNDPATGDIYGKLYNNLAVSDPRNLAPEGWRVPTVEDWMILRAFVGTYDNNPNHIQQINEFGPLPGAFRDDLDSRDSYGSAWWSSTPYTDDRAYAFSISKYRFHPGYSLTIYNTFIQYGYQVRLIKE